MEAEGVIEVERVMEVERLREREKERQRELVRERERETARRIEREREIENARKTEWARGRQNEASQGRQVSKIERRLVRHSSARTGAGHGPPSRFKVRGLPSARSFSQATQPLSNFNTADDQNYDCPLPDSPAPPPYKSPSPDSEQAKFLLQRGRFPLPPSPSQFPYHPSMLGVMPDFGTDMSGRAPEDQSGLHSGAQQLRSPRLHRRSPRLSSRSPPSQSVSPAPDVVLSLSNSLSSISERLPSESARRPEGRSQESPDPEQPHASLSQTEAQSQFHASSEVGSSSISLPQSQVHANSLHSYHSIESRNRTLSTSGDISSPLTPDQLRELDDLIGGVQAMVSDANARSIELFGTQEMEEGGGGEGPVREEEMNIAPPLNSDSVFVDDLIQEVPESARQVEHAGRGTERRPTNNLQQDVQRDGVQEEEGHPAANNGDSNPGLQDNPIMNDTHVVKPEKRVGTETIASNNTGIDKCGSEREARLADPTTGEEFVLQKPSPRPKLNASRLEDVPLLRTSLLPSTYLLESSGGSPMAEEEEEEVSLRYVSFLELWIAIHSETHFMG